MRTLRRLLEATWILAALVLLCTGPGCKPGWSADGKRVAFWYTTDDMDRSFLATYDLESGAVKRAFVSDQYELFRPVFAADGTSLIVLAARESAAAAGSGSLCDLDVLRVRLDPKAKGPTKAYEKITTIKSLQTEPLLIADVIVDAKNRIWWVRYERPSKEARRPERHLPLCIEPATGKVTQPFKNRNLRLFSGRAGIFCVEGSVTDKRVGIVRFSKDEPVIERLPGALGNLGSDSLLTVGAAHLAAFHTVVAATGKQVRLELLIADVSGKLTARIPVPEAVTAIAAATFAEKDRTLWVASQGPEWLLRFNLEKRILETATPVPFDARPEDLAASPEGTHFAGSFTEPTSDGAVLCVFDLRGKDAKIKRVKLPR